jgi:hypothetical protein
MNTAHVLPIFLPVCTTTPCLMCSATACGMHSFSISLRGQRRLVSLGGLARSVVAGPAAPANSQPTCEWLFLVYKAVVPRSLPRQRALLGSPPLAHCTAAFAAVLGRTGGPTTARHRCLFGGDSLAWFSQCREVEVGCSWFSAGIVCYKRCLAWAQKSGLWHVFSVQQGCTIVVACRPRMACVQVRGHSAGCAVAFPSVCSDPVCIVLVVYTFAQ